MEKRLFLINIIAMVLLSCSGKPAMEPSIISRPGTGEKVFTYLALGDSYTIGESVTQEASFPFQLKTLLGNENIRVVAPVVVAKTGWTTDELQNAITERAVSGKFDFVTLLIGVNNQYRGYAPEVYRKEFKALLETAITYAAGDKKKVFVVSIPDWGVTPFGKGSGRDLAKIAAEIDLFNQVNKEETLARGVSYTDITPGSRNAATDAALVAADGLHPSGKMYAAWAAALLPQVQAVLK